MASVAAVPELISTAGGPALVWRYGQPRLVLSSASVGGGLGQRQWVLNIEVEDDYARQDLDNHVSEVATELDLAGEGVGLLTAARVGMFSRVAVSDVAVCATVGLSHPTWAAAPSEDGLPGSVGTINIVVDLRRAVTPAALVNLVVTATEAKTQALLDRGVDGTGTASDAVVITCPTSGEADRFGGPRSAVGSVVARCVHAAVLERTGVAR